MSDPTLTVEERIVSEILKDLKGRSGLRHQWEQIDEDIQQEIIQRWVAIVEARLPKEKP